jgi:hypothetical protein
MLLRCHLHARLDVTAALHKFQPDTLTKPADAPHAWNQPTYGGTKIQYAPESDPTTPLTTPQVPLIQHVIGMFLYYSITINCTMLVALGTIAATQTNATEYTVIAVVQLVLNYAATHPNAVI